MLFVEVEPLTDRRHLKVTERRTRQDWAGLIKAMLDERYPDAVKVSLVMDNLNTHDIASTQLHCTRVLKHARLPLLLLGIVQEQHQRVEILSHSVRLGPKLFHRGSRAIYPKGWVSKPFRSRHVPPREGYK